MIPYDVVWARANKKSSQRILLLELLLIKDILEHHPDRRSVHLAKHSKKYRVRKKNMNKILLTSNGICGRW